MKKIALMLNTLSYGGIERVMADLSIGLTKKGYHVYLFVMSDQDIQYEYSGTLVKIGTFHVKSGFLTVLTCWQHFIGTMIAKKKYKIDVTISSFEYLNIINLLFGRDEKISMLHNYRFQHEVSGSIKDKMIERLFQKLAHRNKYIVCVSKGIEGKAKQIYKNVEIRTIYNGLNVGQIQKIKEQTPPGIHLPYNEKTFVHVSRICRQKAQHRLIEAFARVHKKHPDASLVIVGGGPDEEELQKTVDRLGLKQSVTFTGFIKNPIYYMKNARAFVLSSDYEGFGNVLIEAMFCETPVISTDCQSGPREIIAPGTKELLKEGIEMAEYGILTSLDSHSLAEAMLKILEEEPIYLKYKDRSFERSGYFKGSTTIREWVRLLG